MNNEFRVIDIDPRLDFTRRFSQAPKCGVHLNREVVDKMGLVDGDLIEIKGKRTTVGRVVSVDKNGFDMNAIGLNNLVRNNARVSPEEAVAIGKIESKIAEKIVLAPIEKSLRKSELVRGLAKNVFMDTPFVEGDVTYLRSKMLSYTLGSITWLRVVKTDPSGVVVVGEDTEFEIVPDPINQDLSESTYYLPDLGTDDDFGAKGLLLDDNEWTNLNSLLEIGLFSNLAEAITFFIREGIKSRSDIFEKSESIAEQIRQLKNSIKS